MPQITLDGIRDRLLSNSHRQELFAKFEQELQSWTSYLGEIQIWFFGSFFTDEEQPGDIDVLLAGRLKSETRFQPRLTRQFKDEVHVVHSLCTSGMASKEDLVRKFNEQEGNQRRGIQLAGDDVIELVT